MKENKAMVLSITAVALIAILVIGGTYAYWNWQSANNTAITFTVGGGTMTIDGGGNITTKVLAPAQCTNSTYAIQRKVKVTASNETASAMTASVSLDVTALTAAHGTLNSTNKANIKYALVTITQSNYQNAAFTKTGDACATSATTSGNFGSISTGDSIALLSGLTVPAASGSTPGSFTGYYELYLWIDKTYGDGTYGATGTTVSDPLQDLTINLTWNGSMTNE